MRPPARRHGAPVERAKVVAQAAALLERGDLERLERLLAPSLARPAPPAAALVLAGEVALARDRHQAALDLARRAVAADATAEARWLLGRALVAADELDEAGLVLRSVQGRGVAAHALLELEAARRRLEGVLAFKRAYERGTEGYRQIPGQVSKLASALVDAGERCEAGTEVMPGHGVAVRLQRSVLALDGEVLRLWHTEEEGRVPAVELERHLRALADLAPGPDARALALLAECVRGLALVRPGEEPALADRLLESSSGVSPRYRALALAVRVRLLGPTERQRLDELARGELALAVDTSVGDRLHSWFEGLRERVVEGYTWLAWRDPARRRAALVRALALCDRAPHNPEDGGIPRERMRAALLAGDARQEGRERLGEAERLLFDAELALLAGEAAAAEELLSALLRSKASRQPLVFKRGDALCALAVARALRGDVDGARAALDEAGRSDGEVWLPWRELELTRRTVALIEAEEWRPGPGEPFPPQLAPGGRW